MKVVAGKVAPVHFPLPAPCAPHHWYAYTSMYVSVGTW